MCIPGNPHYSKVNLIKAAQVKKYSTTPPADPLEFLHRVPQPTPTPAPASQPEPPVTQSLYGDFPI